MSEQFQRLVEQAPDGVVILEAGRIVFINATAQRLLGVSQEVALGQPIAMFLPPADAQAAMERIMRMLRTGEEMAPNEYGTLADPDRVVEIKSMVWEWQGRTAVLAFARDVTERRQLQRQLVRADRLAALGTLAAGVAHEINNPLTYVQASLQLIRRALGPAISDDLAASFGNAQHGIDRIAAITRSLRLFVQPGYETPAQPIDATVALERAIDMVQHDLRHRAQLVRRLREVPRVIANAPQLEQVLVNLLLNAIQALEGKPGDAITIELEPRGETVAILVRDTGCGMSPAVRDRVFDPFFTTRKVGEGMGLGLAISKSIVDSLGGELRLDSTAGVGTLATVILPAQREPLPRAPSVPDEVTPRRRVLLIDDDDLVRGPLARLLAEYHDIVTAGDGEAAIALIRDQVFDAILCDVMMPNRSGLDVYRAIEVAEVARRFVFITGGTFAPGLAEAIAETGNPVLEKPFDLAAALRVIAAV